MIKNEKELQITKQLIERFKEDLENLPENDDFKAKVLRDAHLSMIKDLEDQVNEYKTGVGDNFAKWQEIFVSWKKWNVSKTVDGLQDFLEKNYQAPNKKNHEGFKAWVRAKIIPADKIWDEVLKEYNATGKPYELDNFLEYLRQNYKAIKL